MNELIYGPGRTRIVRKSSGETEEWLEVELVPERGILILQRHGERRLAVLGRPTSEDWSCYELERFDLLKATLNDEHEALS